MQISTRQTPAFGVARLTLAPSEAVRTEAGARVGGALGGLFGRG